MTKSLKVVLVTIIGLMALLIPVIWPAASLGEVHEVSYIHHVTSPVNGYSRISLGYNAQTEDDIDYSENGIPANFARSAGVYVETMFSLSKLEMNGFFQYYPDHVDITCDFGFRSSLALKPTYFECSASDS